MLFETLFDELAVGGLRSPNATAVDSCDSQTLSEEVESIDEEEEREILIYC